jgi:two-component system cell cycle response regulator DivK
MAHKVLLVEDSLEGYILVDRVLGARGYEVVHAPDGERGIQLAVETAPDLILIDIGLPDIDGNTVVALLRQVSELDGVPLVAITAWPPDIAQDICDRYGFDGLITKPISVRDFPRQIARFLGADD